MIGSSLREEQILLYRDVPGVEDARGKKRKLRPRSLVFPARKAAVPTFRLMTQPTEQKKHNSLENTKHGIVG